MKCPQCGSINTNEVNFCSQCGETLNYPKNQKSGWSTFSPQKTIPIIQVRQPMLWEGGSNIDALKLFVLKPKNTASLIEDPNAPMGIVFFFMSMLIASFTQGYISSRIITYSYLDGELISKTTGNFILTMISTIVSTWFIGTLILAGLIVVGRPKTSPLMEKNAFMIAASINGYRSIVDLIYYLFVLVLLPFEQNTIIEVYQKTDSFESLFSPEIITLQMPSPAYQFSVQLVSILTFAYSYYLLYQVLTHGLRLEGFFYKFVLIGYVAFTLFGKVMQLISILNLF